MQSFGYGDQVVLASSIPEGLAAIAALNELSKRVARREYLCTVKHGHDFGWYMKCSCGLSERSYHVSHPADRTLCPNLAR